MLLMFCSQDTDVIADLPVVESGETFTASNATASLVCTKPVGLSEGEMILAFVMTDATGKDHGAPVGWSNVFEDYGPTSVTTSVFYKIADSSDVAASNFTFTCDASEAFGVHLLRVSGANATQSQPISQKTAVQSRGSTNTLTEITTDTANCLLFAIANVADGNGDWTGNDPATYTAVQYGQARPGNTAGVATGVWQKDHATAGATSDVVFAAIGDTANVSETHSVSLIAIQP